MIIVTRPYPEGEVLTQQLIEAKIPAQHLPLFDISIGDDLFNLPSELTKLKPSDIVIVTSPQVTYIIKSNLPNLLLPKNIRYFAIGNKSAKLFSQLTNSIISYPKQENSEGLLQLLEEISLNNRSVLILRGDTGRSLLVNTLTHQKAKVKLIECYRRNPILYPPNILADHIEKQVIISTSTKHLLQLEAYCHNKHKQQANLIVTSWRIFTKAKCLNWQKVLLIDGANNQILFKTIITLCHNANI